MESLDEWFETPTTVRVEAALGLMDRVVDRQRSGCPTLDDVVDISAATGMLGESAEDLQFYMTGQMLAVAEADKIIQEHPELAAKIASIAFQFTVSAASLVRGNIAIRLAGLGKRLAPLAAQSAVKASAVERAKVIASELWQADSAQELRVGDMAEKVYRRLDAEGFTAALPDTVERIKEWIKVVAPGYARKGGRRKPPRA